MNILIFNCPDSALIYLNTMAGMFDNPYARICRHVLDDVRFKTGYGSLDKHHNYKGGLVIHTAEVTQYAYKMAVEVLEPSRLRTLIVAAIWHDYCKIHEYVSLDTGGTLGHGKTQYKDLIYHISGSYAEFYRVAYGDLTRGEIDAIGHCILSHHSVYGRGIEPQTKEAIILHAADMLSSRAK